MKRNLLFLILVASIFTSCGCTNKNKILNHTPETIRKSPDKYTWYMKDYVGRNLASCGYYSLGGDLLDTYGEGTIELIVITDDGSYVDISNDDVLKNYVVSSQSISPNTEIKYTFDSDYGFDIVETQTIEEIELHVTKIDN